MPQNNINHSYLEVLFKSFNFIILIFLHNLLFSQTDFSKKEFEIAKFSLSNNVDSSIYKISNSDNKFSDKWKFNYLFFNGNLIDGISNIIGVPRNNIYINHYPKNMSYIKYEVYMHDEYDFYTTKKNLLQFLEKTYSFSLRETGMWNTYDSWKFIVKDSTKLPFGNMNKYLSKQEIESKNYNHSLVYLSENTIKMENGRFDKVLIFAENISGYYCTNENIKNLNLDIPISVFKTIDSANNFFNKYGIEVVWSRKDAKFVSLTFFE